MIPIKSQMLTFVQKSDVNGGNRNVSTGINSKIGPLIHEQTMNWIKINRIQLAITVIGLLSFLCFLPSISNEFVFDDIPTIINNKDVCPEKTYFTKIFFNDFWGTPIVKEESHKSYRPLTILTFRWNFMLHGLQVTGYHLVNNILHSIVSILFFRLCLCFTHHFWESFIASIYFAIHPIHVDAVASIVGRAELLSALFSLSGLLYYCSYNGNNHDNNGDNNTNNDNKNNNPDKCILIVFLLTFLGTFCKEQASTTLIVCIFHQILFKFNLRTKMINCTKRWIYRFKCYIDSQLTSPKQVSHCKLSTHKMVPGQLKSASTFYKNIFYLSIGFVTISCLRFAIMNNKLPSFNRLDNPARILASPYRQLNYAYIWTYNCWLLLNPFNLSCDWSSSSIQLITSLLDPKNVITLATFIFTLLLLLQSDTVSWMGLGFMMITFLPASNIFFPLGFVIAERVLYLPSMGFSIIIARGFVLLYSSIKSKRYWIKILFHLVTFICASSLLVKTVHRCTEWQNELSLFTSGLNVNPTNVKLLNNVGRLYENQGNLSMALSFYEKAVSIQPDDVRGYLNLGKALTKIGRLEEAERSYRKALDLIPRPNEISSKLNSNHYLPVSHHHPYNENDDKLSEDKQREQQELPPSSIKSSSYGDDRGTEQSIVASTGRLTLPGYERLVNQGTNTDTMMNHNEGNHEVKVSPSLASPSGLPLADKSGLTAITLNHLQGLLHYASLISKDERRLDEANRMFSTIASMRPDYSVTYSTWIQSMIHGNDQNNDDGGTRKGSPQNDQAQNGQILLSQVTSNNKQTDPDILYNMAILFNNNGNIENALNLFDQALSIDPYHEETLLTSARIIKDNELIGDYLTIAMERLETLVSMGKADETVYFDLGMLAIRSGHMLTARRYFAKAIDLKPNFTEALFNMALLLYKDEKPKDALPFLKFLLKTEETHGKALLLMVAINSSNNDADEQNDLPKSQQLSSPVSPSLSPS